MQLLKLLQPFGCPHVMIISELVLSGSLLATYAGGKHGLAYLDSLSYGRPYIMALARIGSYTEVINPRSTFVQLRRTA